MARGRARPEAAGPQPPDSSSTPQPCLPVCRSCCFWHRVFSLSLLLGVDTQEPPRGHSQGPRGPVYRPLVTGAFPPASYWLCELNAERAAIILASAFVDLSQNQEVRGLPFNPKGNSMHCMGKEVSNSHPLSGALGLGITSPDL